MLSLFQKTRILLLINFPEHSKGRTIVLKVLSYPTSKYLIPTIGCHFSHLLKRKPRPRKKCWVQCPSVNQCWARTRTHAPGAKTGIPPTTCRLLTAYKMCFCMPVDRSHWSTQTDSALARHSARDRAQRNHFIFSKTKMSLRLRDP